MEMLRQLKSFKEMRIGFLFIRFFDQFKQQPKENVEITLADINNSL